MDFICSKMQPKLGTSQSRTSRFRGLSYDKMWLGWRVRIYWKKKQRHVGRYPDEITAAKAYDKAAVYLYGINAVTNFGLQACLADPSEVSPHILRAKGEVTLEEQRQLQQHVCLPVQPATSSCSTGCSMLCYNQTQQQVHIASAGVQEMSAGSNLPAGPLLDAATTTTATASVPSSSMILQQEQARLGAVQQQAFVLICGGSSSTCSSASEAAGIHWQQQQQQQQSCLPLQLQSVGMPAQMPQEPQLVTLAEHMSATAASYTPALATTKQADPLLYMLPAPISCCTPVDPTGPWTATATASSAAAAAMPAATPAVSMGLPVAAYLGSQSSGATCMTSGNYGDMMSPFQVPMPHSCVHAMQQCFVPPVTMACEGSGSSLQSCVVLAKNVHSPAPSAGSVDTAGRFEQQLQLMETMSASSNSSSCSPVAAVTAAQLLNPVTRALMFGCQLSY